MAEGEEVRDLVRGLRLAVIALVSAAATAGLVIALFGGQPQSAANPHYSELTMIAEGR